MYRRYPVFPIIIRTSSRSIIRDACLDSGADDTILEVNDALALGIDLTHAPEGEARAVGGGVLRYRYAAVTLRVSDANETCTWDTLVGFIARPLRWALLGRTGFLPFFDAKLLGLAEEVQLEPNASFPGQHVVH